MDKNDYLMYLELLKKYKEQYKFKLFSFALMPDSISLLMELKQGETISMIMHDLNSNYTKYFNNRYCRKGHLFRERFQSLVVEKESYLLNIIRYIHLMPVKSKLASHPSEYAFSSHIAYLYYSEPQKQDGGGAPRALIADLAQEVREALDLIAKNFPDKKDYADFIGSVTDEEIAQLMEKLSKSGLLGSRGFVDSVKAEIKKREPHPRKEINLMKTAVPSFIIILTAATAITVIYHQYLPRGQAAPAVPAAVSPPPAPAQPATVEIIKERLIKVSLEELEGTEWIIELMPEGSVAGSYPTYDRIIFKQGTVSAKYFSSNGFMDSNYNLAKHEDGTLSWETMQRDKEGGIVYWLGEEKDGSMKGVFERKFKDGRSERVSFKSPGYYKIKE